MNIVICDTRSQTRKHDFTVNLTDGPQVSFPQVWGLRKFKSAKKALGYVEQLVIAGNQVANMQALELLKNLEY